MIIVQGYYSALNLYNTTYMNQFNYPFKSDDLLLCSTISFKYLTPNVFSNNLFYDLDRGDSVW